MRRLPTASCRADHPRVCGEHLATVYNRVYSNGSPPRLRGALAHASIRDRVMRITPAFAGSTGGPAAPPRRLRDHPRVCGEHCDDGHLRLFGRGSPPRLRGAPGLRSVDDDLRRITPAFAGSTNRSVKQSAPNPDHPRVCGEHHRVVRHLCLIQGSPPRLRGAHLREIISAAV